MGDTEISGSKKEQRLPEAGSPGAGGSKEAAVI
jgi:hypothetical protein